MITLVYIITYKVSGANFYTIRGLSQKIVNIGNISKHVTYQVLNLAWMDRKIIFQLKTVNNGLLYRNMNFLWRDM